MAMETPHVKRWRGNIHLALFVGRHVRAPRGQRLGKVTRNGQKFEFPAQPVQSHAANKIAQRRALWQLFFLSSLFESHVLGTTVLVGVVTILLGHYPSLKSFFYFVHGIWVKIHLATGNVVEEEAGTRLEQLRETYPDAVLSAISNLQRKIRRLGYALD